MVRSRGPAADLHGASADALAAGPARLARVLTADRPALVLGSHQPDDHFDLGAVRRAGLDLARRRSGGGAVIVGEAHVLWVDFVIRPGDPLWDDDIRRSPLWVGEAWRAALGTGEVWAGGLVSARWSAAVCFAGLGPGEVTVAGRKTVGVSQRRARGGALFQTAVLLDWRPEEYYRLLAGVSPSAPVPGDLRDAAIGASGVDPEELLARLLDAVPA